MVPYIFAGERGFFKIKRVLAFWHHRETEIHT